MLETHVVGADIPLLLSRESLKRAEAEIDFQHDTIRILGEKVGLRISTTGHLLLPLTSDLNSHHSLLTSPILPDNPNLKGQLLKLHKQFAHPGADKLKQLIKKSGTNDKSIDALIDHVTEQCDTCKRFKRPLPRPVVALPSSTEFNETVAMDTKFINSFPVLHLIDHVTRYSAATKMNNKKPMSVIQAILVIWVRIFGHPKYFLFDNGGEFINDEVEELCEKFNISIRTTAAESPWSNGLCERANDILADMVEKVMHDTGCSLDLAIPWAISAKNALANTYGFSPNQLVFGKNIQLPDVHTDLPPAENNGDIGNILAQHLIALHKSRQAFIAQESCEKLRRALNKQTRTYADSSFHIGDLVYYKRNNRHEWHGPAKVLGQDGSQFLLKHGGRFIRVHQCKLQLTGAAHVHTPTNLESQDGSNETNIQSKNITADNETNVESGSESEPETLRTADQNVPDDRGDNRNALSDTPRSPTPPNEPTIQSHRNTPRALARLADFNLPPTTVEPEEVFHGIATNSSRFRSAKEDEIRKWQDMKVYTEVDDIGQPRISTKWVCTEKVKGDQLVLKARLVARGFEEDTSQLRSDSPTCSKESLRILLSILAGNHWDLRSMDIKGAFLQGLPISRELYLQPPHGFGQNKLWKLEKTPYGLVDAGRKWYIRLVDVFSKLKALSPKADKAVFFWKNPCGELSGILAAHVDDFLYGGDDHFISNVLPGIQSAFDVGTEENGCMKYLGLSVQQCPQHISLSLAGRDLDEIDTSQLGSDKSRPLESKEITSLRSKIGQINWIASQSRPDLAYDSCVASNSLRKPTVGDILLINKIVRKSGGKNLHLLFPTNIHLQSCQVVAFCDASFANLPDRGSQGGFVAFLVDKQGVYSLISWQSKRIKRVVNSTLAAECLVAVDTAEHCLLLKSILDEIMHTPSTEIKISILSDNRSLVDAVHTTTQMENKRLQIDISILREMLELGDLHQFRWIETKYQVANALTKAGAPSDYLMNIIRSELKFNFNSGIFA